MGNRKVKFIEGEYYHIYNRGVEGRLIFNEPRDLSRFIESVKEFNSPESDGGIYRNSLEKYKKKKKGNRLVNIVCYAFNPNHFHFLLTPLTEKGVETFMQKLGTGYTMFFNAKYKRKGSLFQGVFKSSHIDSNEYLLHLSVYINLNNKVHQLRGETSQLVRNSWDNYANNSRDSLLGDTSIIVNQFKNTKEYKKFAQDILPDIIEHKKTLKELDQVMIDED